MYQWSSTLVMRAKARTRILVIHFALFLFPSHSILCSMHCFFSSVLLCLSFFLSFSRLCFCCYFQPPFHCLSLLFPILLQNHKRVPFISRTFINCRKKTKKIVLTTSADDSVLSLLRHFYSGNNLQSSRLEKDLNL